MNRIGIKAMSTKELLRRMFRLGFGILCIAGATVFMVWMFGRGKEFLLQSPYFSVQTIIVEGVSKPIEAKIRERMGTNEMAQNMLLLRVEPLREDLMKIPEVRRVNVQRVMPDALIIQASERIPALMVTGENTYILDSELYVISAADSRTFMESRLPLFTSESQNGLEIGKKASTPGLAGAWNAYRMISQKTPELFEKIAETHVSDNGEITLIFNGGKEARLGRRNPANVLPVLEAFWRETDAMDNVAYVELDYRNQAAFRRIRVPASDTAPHENKNKAE